MPLLLDNMTLAPLLETSDLSLRLASANSNSRLHQEQQLHRHEPVSKIPQYSKSDDQSDISGAVSAPGTPSRQNLSDSLSDPMEIEVDDDADDLENDTNPVNHFPQNTRRLMSLIYSLITFSASHEILAPKQLTGVRIEFTNLSKKETLWDDVSIPVLSETINLIHQQLKRSLKTLDSSFNNTNQVFLQVNVTNLNLRILKVWAK